jgi:hypothetical protein
VLDVDISGVVGEGRPRVGWKQQVENEVSLWWGCDVKIRRKGL